MKEHSFLAMLAVYTPLQSMNDTLPRVLIIPSSSDLSSAEEHNHLCWLAGVKVTPQQRKNLSDALNAAGDLTIQPQKINIRYLLVAAMLILTCSSDNNQPAFFRKEKLGWCWSWTCCSLKIVQCPAGWKTKAKPQDSEQWSTLRVAVCPNLLIDWNVVFNTPGVSALQDEQNATIYPICQTNEWCKCGSYHAFRHHSNHSWCCLCSWRFYIQACHGKNKWMGGFYLSCLTCQMSSTEFNKGVSQKKLDIPLHSHLRAPRLDWPRDTWPSHA